MVTAAAAALRGLAALVLCAALAAAMPARAAEGGEECVSGHVRASDEGAAGGCGGNCYCLGGHWVCPEGDCGPPQGAEPQQLRAEEPRPLPLRRSKRGAPSGEGVVATARCQPHERFRLRCNDCVCPTSGIRAHAPCTVLPCAPAPPARAPGDGPAPAPLLASTQRPCSAAEKAAAASHCVAVPLDGERCAPGVTYMDECNTCICSQDGIKAHASCTFKICPK